MIGLDPAAAGVVGRQPTVVGLDQVKAVLPHRYPMLLVDRITEHVPGERITALKAVSVNEPWYRTVPDGAPRGAYAYPAAMLVESWCHAAGVLCAWDQPNPDVLTGQVMMFGSMTGISFHRPVFPGDLVEHRVQLVRALTDAKVFAGESLVAGEPAAVFDRIVMAMRPAGQVPARVSGAEVHHANV